MVMPRKSGYGINKLKAMVPSASYAAAVDVSHHETNTNWTHTTENGI